MMATDGRSVPDGGFDALVTIPMSKLKELEADVARLDELEQLNGLRGGLEAFAARRGPSVRQMLDERIADRNRPAQHD